MLTGDNSILKRAGEAKEKTEIAETKEQVQIQVLGSFEEGANLNLKALKTNLESIGAKVIADNFPVTAILNHKSYKIDASGNVEMQENADRTGINVGDYINFEPDTDQDAEGNPIAKTYSKDFLVSKYTGISNSSWNYEDLVQNTLKWQVLKKYEDGSIKIVGTETSQLVGFFDAVAYNNAVWILNDICEKLYSKKSAGIIARSISLEDFEDDDYYVSETKGNWRAARDNYIKGQIQTRKTELDNESSYIQAVDTINNMVTYKKDYSYYPTLYAYEIGSGIDTTTIKINGITRSDGYATNRQSLEDFMNNNTSKQANNYLTVKYTGYEIDIDETNYGEAYKVLNGVADYWYWLASREVVCDSNRTKFGIYRVFDGFRFLCNLYNSNNAMAYAKGSVRPIVTIGPNVKITPSETASSEDGIPHEITSYK